MTSRMVEADRSLEFSGTGTVHGKTARPIFVLDFDDLTLSSPTEEEKALLEKMENVVRVYKESRGQFTLDLEITEDAFKRLLGKPRMAGDGYSRLLKIVEDGVETYHLVISPYTNVEEIRGSENRDRIELILTTGGFTFMYPELAFGLVPISSDGSADINDRSPLYPQELKDIKLISIDIARGLIATEPTGS